MFDYNLIKKMNSKNISEDIELTKERINNIWKTITREEKHKAVLVGGFSSSRSFNKTRKTGLLSIRMALALSVALKINPFYISAEETEKNDYSEEKLISFIENKNISGKFEMSEKSVIQNDLIKSFLEVIEKIDEKTIENMDKLKKEEILTLVDSVFIKEKVGKKKNKILLIKLILTQ